MGFLEAVGIPLSRLTGRKKISFKNIVGKGVFFHYTPPIIGDDGKPKKGSYADFSYYTKSEYSEIQKAISGSDDDTDDDMDDLDSEAEEEEAPVEKKAKKKAKKKKEPEPEEDGDDDDEDGDDDFDFLDDDD